MSSKELIAAFNDQVALEFTAAFSYLSLAAWFDAANLPGFANWMERQYEEEIEHALKFRRYLLDRGQRVELKDIPAPPAGFASPLAAAEHALAGEESVTTAIHAIYGRAVEEQDYSCMPLLQWFMDEQVEEEAAVGLLVERVRMAGDNSAALLMLDRELAERGETAG